MKETASSLGLPESSAILRYLADKKNVPDHWYPRGDRTLRALVDAAMAWHASTLRIGSMIVVWNLAIVRNLGRQGNHALVEDYGIPTLRSALKDLDAYWLKERKFVAGNDISVADLLIACEVEQLCLLDAVAAITDGRSPSMQTLLDPHQQIQEWLKRVRESCGRQYEEVHKVLRNVRDRMVTHFASKL
jgi:glutathione S-transferase